MLLRSRPVVAAALRARRYSLGLVPGVPRRLDDVVKTDVFEREEPARVSAIWEAYHSERAAVAGAAVEANEHRLILQRAQESAMFIYPVFREAGYFMLVSQFDARTSMFAMANLEDYRRSASLAPPWRERCPHLPQ